MTLDQDLLAKILEAAPNGDDGLMGPKLREARFRRTIFEGNVDFGDVTFEGTTFFDDAVFKGFANFRDARFLAAVYARTASFHGGADFSEASFEDGAYFLGTAFGKRVDFIDVSFHGEASFQDTSYSEAAHFHSACFHADADLSRASFKDTAGLADASFLGEADFTGATIANGFGYGSFTAGTLRLDSITFTSPVQLKVAARRLSLQRTRFTAGGHLRIAWAEITLEEADVPQPLILSKYEPPAEFLEDMPCLDGIHDPASAPSLVSVQRANLEKLTVTDIDLRECRFAGAHHLDQLSITIEQDTFHRAPIGQGSRHVIAEEREWRACMTKRKRGRWQLTSEPFRSEFLKDARRPGPSELANLYRQLRKGQEDAKNEPGAASFYYGEMEMRRRASSTPPVERFIIWLYWLVSGYGLRAARAFTAMAIVIVATTTALTLVGIPEASAPAITSGSVSGPPSNQRIELRSPPTSRPQPPRSSLSSRLEDRRRIEKAMRTSLNAVLFRSGGQPLTDAGQYIEMAARFLGPVLLGLALLSIRGRVKR